MDRPLRVNSDRALPEDARILGATFTKVGRRWRLALTFDSASVIATSHAHPDAAVGGDLGVEALLTLSTGERIENRRPASRREREIRISRRALARCQRGSNRRRKVKAKLARDLRCVADQRSDHLHNGSASLAKRFALIVLEELKIRNPTRSPAGTVEELGVHVAQQRGLNREILDAAWRLIDYIRYKAVRAGGAMKLRDARRSAGTCSRCGTYAVKPLSLRWHSCACGASLHRDANAARVMLAREFAAMAATGEAVLLGTPTWTVTPCVVPERASPQGADDETLEGASTPDNEEPMTPQAWHDHIGTCSARLRATMPQAVHIRVLEKKRVIETQSRPYHAAVFRSIARSDPQAAA